MERIKNNPLITLGSLLAIAITIFALFFFLSADNFSKQGSYIEVKGLSEQIVKSDTAIWTLSFEVKSNNIETLYSDIEKNVATIKKFLMDKGFESSEISVAPMNIYQDTYREAAFRFNATGSVAVYSAKVDLAKQASGDTLLLIKNGVVLNYNNIIFEFSDINSIKPAMLADALGNAKDTAAQFADNSNARLGRVIRGNQGTFEITDKDPGSPEYKKIRLVSTLRFILR
jgi:hypothetical protein